MDALKPEIGILIKLGSLAVHVEEFFSSDGHWMDKEAINSLLCDAEIVEWLKEMDKDALLPKKRLPS